MENLAPDKGEIVLYSAILDVSLEQGWITEDEKLRIDSKMTLSEKKLEFFELMKANENEESAIRLLRAIRCINEVESLSKRNEEVPNQFPAMIMSKLIEKSLLDREKGASFVRRINVENVQEKVESAADAGESAKKAMMLSPVIRCIFQYLNLEDIKRCRCISKEWKSVSEPVLRARSKIKFESKMTTSKFYRQFESTLETIPFTAFRIDRSFSYPYGWALSDANDFFQRQREYLRELEIENLYVANEDGEIINRTESFDITPWIENTPIARKNTKYHTKLKITRYLKMQSTVLAHIKELSLRKCQVDLQDDIKFQPIKLKLETVAFLKLGKMLPELSINDIMDFSRVKHMDLEYSRRDAQETKLSLDLKGNNSLNLDYLRLEGITVTNWRECTWTIDKLEISWGPFVEKTEMKIRELDLCFLVILDLSVLPKSLEKLTINFAYLETCLTSHNIILDNLHSLTLDELNEESVLIISKCVQFPNLVDLNLNGATDFQGQLEINSDWISRSVKTITLSRVIVNWAGAGGSKDFDLDKLVLADDDYFSSVKKIGDILSKTKELVLHCDHKIDCESVSNLLEYVRLKNCSNYLQRIYVGPFKWRRGYSFEDSPLVDYVDKEGEYYVFEKQKGVALDISYVEFYKFVASN